MVKFALKGLVQKRAMSLHLNFMKNFHRKRAFTLIEMVVAVGLFSIVMMVALAIILSVVDNNKKVHSVNVVVNNLNFAIDSMVRDIKTGVEYGCTLSTTLILGGSCSGSDDNITLISTLSDQNKIVEYRFVANEETGGKILKSSCVLNATGDGCEPGTQVYGNLTSSEINITDATFVVNQGSEGVSQPAVFLQIKGTSAINPTEASDFKIQTLISQRYLNI